MNTRGYGGRTIKKIVSIMTNDPSRPHAQLQISGAVEKFVTISPRIIRLMGEKGKPVQTTVKIIPEKKYPFSILSIKAKNGKNIHYSIDKISGETKGYLLHVENIRKNAGIYHDSIVLKTNNKIQPEIPIMVYARIIDPAAPRHKIVNSKGNPFLELIQKMQKQRALKQGKTQPVSRDPAKTKELKKKFEELINQTQKQK